MLHQQQRRAAAVTKLASEQSTMVASLERMSWPVVLLATATFIAFLQPPGSYDDSKHITIPPHSTCEGWRDPNSEEFRRCASLLFFVFDALSFGLSIGCVVMIVVVSMPRLKYKKDDEYEAGRFWLLLLSTWLLLWLAVVTCFCAFLASGLAVSPDWRVVIGPLVPGMVLLLAGLFLLGRRFHSLRPSWSAIFSVCNFKRHHERQRYMQLDFDDDIEIGQQKSKEYWSNAAKALCGASTSPPTAQSQSAPPSGSQPPPSPRPAPPSGSQPPPFRAAHPAFRPAGSLAN